MELLIAKVRPDGSSYLAERRTVAPSPVPGSEGLAVAALFGTDASPPPACPRGGSHHSPTRLVPGAIGMHYIVHPPRDPAALPPDKAMHWGDKIDVVTILEGGGAMLLGDGTHPLGVGDCIVMPGADHVFLPAPEGCRMIVFAVGTPPAAG